FSPRRRRHTRSARDWSSDVCSSDLKGIDNRASCVILVHLLRRLQSQSLSCRLTALVTVQEEVGLRGAQVAFARLQPDLAIVVDRSEERRVGKVCSAQWCGGW